MSDLKPCPFCGAPAEIDRDYQKRIKVVGCSNDECWVSPVSCAATEQEAIDRWNKRS